MPPPGRGWCAGPEKGKSRRRLRSRTPPPSARACRACGGADPASAGGRPEIRSWPLEVDEPSRQGFEATVAHQTDRRIRCEGADARHGDAAVFAKNSSEPPPPFRGYRKEEFVVVSA